MGRSRWKQNDQTELLGDEMPRYLAASKTGGLPDFYNGVLQAWIKKWPLEAPTSEQVAKAGSEKAARLKQTDALMKVSAFIVFHQSNIVLESKD